MNVNACTLRIGPKGPQMESQKECQGRLLADAMSKPDRSRPLKNLSGTAARNQTFCPKGWNPRRRMPVLSWTIRWKRCGVEVRISRTRYSKADQSEAKSGPRSLRSNLWMAWVPSKASRMDCALAVAASTSIDRIKAFFMDEPWVKRSPHNHTPHSVFQGTIGRKWG